MAGWRGGRTEFLVRFKTLLDSGHMPKISPGALREVQDALDHYNVEVKQTNLAEWSKKTYLDHALQFVRWLNDEFTPGEKTR